jgi:hypothetical protein
LKCHNYEIITWNNYWSWMIYFVKWNNYLKCHHITDGHTDDLSSSAFHREFENNYLKCHHIIDGNTDDLSPSAFHREFENNYLKCHHITDGHTDALSPSAFYREFENNYLKCHHITDGHTDDLSPSVFCRRVNFTDKITDGLQKIWRVIEKIGAKFKIYRRIFNTSPTE